MPFELDVYELPRTVLPCPIVNPIQARAAPVENVIHAIHFCTLTVLSRGSRTLPHQLSSNARITAPLHAELVPDRGVGIVDATDTFTAIGNALPHIFVIPSSRDVNDTFGEMAAEYNINTVNRRTP